MCIHQGSAAVPQSPLTLAIVKDWWKYITDYNHFKKRLKTVLNLRLSRGWRAAAEPWHTHRARLIKNNHFNLNAAHMMCHTEHTWCVTQCKLFKSIYYYLDVAPDFHELVAGYSNDTPIHALHSKWINELSNKSGRY